MRFFKKYWLEIVLCVGMVAVICMSVVTLVLTIKHECNIEINMGEWLPSLREVLHENKNPN